MLNQAAAEALYSATYVENYLDCLENLPDDLQRQLSRLRELDALYQGDLLSTHFFSFFYIAVFTGFTEDLAELTASLRKEEDTSALRKLQTQMQQTLIKAQEVGDEKLQAVNTLQELIENQARLLETDSKNLGANSQPFLFFLFLLTLYYWRRLWQQGPGEYGAEWQRGGGGASGRDSQRGWPLSGRLRAPVQASASIAPRSARGRPYYCSRPCC